MKDGKIRRLYLYRLDRLTRSGIRDTLAVVEEFRAAGCELVSVADGFDLHGPAAEIIMAVMAWGARMERLAINERISSARIRLEAEGRAWGRPRRLDADQVRRVQDLRAAGKSLRQIAAMAKTPLATVARTLRAGPAVPKSTPRAAGKKLSSGVALPGAIRK